MTRFEIVVIIKGSSTIMIELIQVRGHEEILGKGGDKKQSNRGGEWSTGAFNFFWKCSSSRRTEPPCASQLARVHLTHTWHASSSSGPRARVWGVRESSGSSFSERLGGLLDVHSRERMPPQSLGKWVPSSAQTDGQDVLHSRTDAKTFHGGVGPPQTLGQWDPPKIGRRNAKCPRVP